MTKEQIIKLRLDLGLSARAMARALDVDRGTIHRWETGETEPRGIVLARLKDLALDAEINKRIAEENQTGPSFLERQKNFKLPRKNLVKKRLPWGSKHRG